MERKEEKLEEYVDELCGMEQRLFDICKELNLDFSTDKTLTNVWSELYELVKDYEYPESEE